MATANQSETMEVGESQQTLVASIGALILTEMHETEERKKKMEFRFRGNGRLTKQNGGRTFGEFVNQETL